MRFLPVPFLGGDYTDSARAQSTQRTVNYLVVPSEKPGSRTPAKFRTAPGLQEYGHYGTKHRGGAEIEGRCVIVTGTEARQVKPDGSSVLLGFVPGAGRVVIAHNQISNGNEVKFVNGSAGYLWNTVTGAFTRITDPGYPGEITCRFIGSLFVGIEPQRRFVVVSDLANGGEYSTLDRFDGESSPDRMRGLEVAHGELVLFNERTIEHFAYTGEVNALFQNKIITVDRGCAATHSIAKLDNRIFFLGDDGSIYYLDGYTPVRVSTHSEESEIAGLDWSKAYASTFEDEGHKVYYLTFPDGPTLGYDVSSREWHHRQSYGMDRWRLSTLFRWSKRWFGGEFNSGRFYRVDWDYMLEGAQTFSAERMGPVGADDENRLTLHAFKPLYVTGGPLTVAASVFPLSFDLTQTVVDGVTFGGRFPDLAVGDTVDFWYQTKGGTGVAGFAIVDALPAGLSFDNGHVTGTTTTAVTGNEFSVIAVDEALAQATLNESSYVMDMLGDPPDVYTDTEYSYTLTGSDGVAPYTFAKTAGSLPVGIALASDGELSGTGDGTPSSAEFAVTMTDANGVTQTKAYSVETVVAPEDIFDPRAEAVRYLVITDGSETDYSDPEFDDSGWTTGLGGWDSNAGAGPGTVIPQGTNVRLWVRFQFVLSNTAGVVFHYQVDDTVKLYVNGALIASIGIGTGTYAVSSGDLVVGANKIALKMADEGLGRCYLYPWFTQS